MKLTGTWNREDVDDFLTTTVPIRLSCRTPADHLWMLSLWYLWEDDALWCATGADADVVRYLRANDEVAFEVSTNDPPYRGVRGRGHASIDADEEKTLLRRLLQRYLGGTDSALARRLLAPERDEVRIRVDPARLHSWDYSDRMQDS
ncbi:pyridoxamine 5'-phosphate oxidase family protein [Salinigranum halophilum]|jgi:nitroimidazol reductase NimA-like FMN-containing flavoprotein (pyridoxamine 5'-phosphate oxidase superfamily)|uniref:pyridoxamine 5'-phosphate oxidase family protein n=1 Tax=Salinigranum halophilum TaxID=2565931 RepID=UPI0010A7C53A|nr:pyridoxamine 5'-phosphate oxidase family protein [Salinigranum halophilum]